MRRHDDTLAKEIDEEGEEGWLPTIVITPREEPRSRSMPIGRGLEIF